MEDKVKKEKKEKKPNDKKKIKWLPIIFYLVIALSIGLFIFNKYENSLIEQLSITEFEKKLENNELKSLEKITLLDNIGVLQYEIKNTTYEVKMPKNYIKENSDIIDLLKKEKIELDVKNKQEWLLAVSNLTRVLFTILIIYFIFKLSGDFFKGVQIEEVKDEKLTFDDVAGADSVKTEFMDIINYYKNPEKYASYKEDLPNGILLEGPPGNGKTYIAKALAGECKIPFFQISASDLEGKYVGVGSENIGKIFRIVRERAKEAGGSILFLDELDSIASKRELRTVVETNQTINKLLTEMDGFDKESNVIVMGATNLVTSLDEAVIRPGRFDRIIHISRPTKPERIEVLNLYLNKKSERIEKEVYEEKFVETLADITEGFSNAKLANLVKESSVLARRKGKDTIGIQDLREGFTKTVAGVKRNHQMTEEDRKIVAYHEAGHAVAQIMTSPLGVKGVAYITITPYGQSLGHVSPVANPVKLERKSHLENQVIVLLAGRAVEDKILNGDYTVGAASDLHQANAIITNYLTTYGMASHLPNLYIENVDQNNNLFQGNLKKLREEFYSRTQQLIKNHFDMVDILAQHLLEHESIEQYELEQIIAQCPSYLEK